MIKVGAGLAPQWREYELPPAKEGEPAPVDTGPPARFQLRPLTELELIDVRNGISLDGEGELVISGGSVRIALGAVLQWEAVLGQDGAPLICTAANRERLPAKVLVWLALEVLAMNALQETERKNS